MSKGLNRVLLIGNLGAAPEVKTLASGLVANLRIATTESWTDRNTNERKESTEWHNVVIYGPLADVVGKYTTKGSKIYVEGKLKTRKYQDQQGVDRYVTEIVGTEVLLLDKPEGAQQGQYAQAPAQPAYNQAPAQPAYNQAPQQPAYNQAPQQPAYNQAPQQPAYNQAPQQPVYNQAPQQPVYNQAPQQPMYNQAPQQGYQQPMPQQMDDDDIPF